MVGSVSHDKEREEEAMDNPELLRLDFGIHRSDATSWAPGEAKRFIDEFHSWCEEKGLRYGGTYWLEPRAR